MKVRDDSMRFKVVFLSLFAVMLLAACGSDDSAKETEEPTDIKEIVNDYSVGTFENETASITSTELIVTDENDEEKVYPLPEDEFFVSIAPFVDETHPCEIHSLTGCQGEMIEEDFDVYIEDEDGKIIVDETMTSYANGFIDLWLPRDHTYEVTITHEDKQATSELETFEDDGTCVTTFQLI